MRRDRFKLEQEYYLRAQDVDIKGAWMPSAVFVRMQEIAEDHAASVGAGRVDLVDKKGLGWVLTRMAVNMNRYPGIGQTIRVATWPLKPARLIFLRQFQFSDLEGNVLGAASSQWVLFDIGERTLKRTTVLGDYPYDPALPAVMEDPGKIILPAEMEKRETRTVLYGDVDMNVHMNNTKYLTWICELFPSAMLKKQHLESIRINYIAEAYIDQQVDLYMREEGGGWFICGKTDGKTVFDAFVTWKG
jgi:acyl-ACP thioesterase